MKRILLWVAVLFAFGLATGGWPPTTALAARNRGELNLVPDDNTAPVTPSDPDDPTNPGTGSRGLLTLDYLSHLTFSQQTVRAGQLLAPATTRQPVIQVSDRRGSGSGWSLLVRPEPLVGSDGDRLTAAALQLGRADWRAASANVSAAPRVTVAATQELPVGTYSLVAQATGTPGARQGVGTWLLRLNTAPQTAPLQLAVTAAAVSRAQTYAGTLSWQLIDTPQ